MIASLFILPRAQSDCSMSARTSKSTCCNTVLASYNLAAKNCSLNEAFAPSS